MSALADEDAAVVQHHAGEEEGEVPEEMFHFAVATRMGTVDDLESKQNVFLMRLHIENPKIFRFLIGLR